MLVKITEDAGAILVLLLVEEESPEWIHVCIPGSRNGRRSGTLRNVLHYSELLELTDMFWTSHLSILELMFMYYLNQLIRGKQHYHLTDAFFKTPWFKFGKMITTLTIKLFCLLAKLFILFAFKKSLSHATSYTTWVPCIV